MPKIIVTTDFSSSSYNALKYACSFGEVDGYNEVLLLNVFSIPGAYSAEGVALVAVNESMAANETKLKEEIEWIGETHPGCKITYKEVTGDFVKSLEQQIIEENASLVILDAPNGYGDIWLWDTDILNALTHLTVPVLTVPPAAEYKSIGHIAFACILENVNSSTPLGVIKQLAKHTGAKLHVVTVVLPGGNEKAATEGNALLHNMLEGFDTEYYKIYDAHIVAAIGDFVNRNHIDLLFVQPRKHGIWYNLFHKSYSKELARLNLIPVMALPCSNAGAYPKEEPLHKQP